MSNSSINYWKNWSKLSEKVHTTIRTHEKWRL